MNLIVNFISATGSRWRRVAAGSAVLALALAGACADDLPPTEGGPDAAPMSTVSTRTVGDVVETRVDATQSDVWVYFDFEGGPEGAESRVSDPAASRGWDLGFQRFKVRSNGGVSGSAGAEVALVPNTSLEEIESAPAAGWMVDGPDGEDMNMDPDFAFNQGDTWFEYDSTTHVLQPRRQVYVVLTGAGGYFALQLLKYYDDAGSGGYVQFRWKKVKPPSEPRMPAPATPAGPATGP
jgi:hypothetical protein